MRCCLAACSRVYQIALTEYHRTLDSHGVLDFSETLARALALLAQMDEFARSRYRLEGRYHHVLVDEFQDTSRAQWTLVALLIRSWGEGSGMAENAPLVPSIFLVGDRKQSIYSFRDADVAVMEDAGELRGRPARRSRFATRHLEELPRGRRSCWRLPTTFSRRSRRIRRAAMPSASTSRTAFRSTDAAPPAADALGIVAAATVAACAERVAAEVRRLLDRADHGPRSRHRRAAADHPARRRHSVPNEGRPSGIREGARSAERALLCLQRTRLLRGRRNQRRAGAAALSGGAGFQPSGGGVSAVALRPLVRSGAAGACAESGGRADGPSPSLRTLDAEGPARAGRVRESVRRWLALADRVPPAELLEMALDETAYLFETRGPRVRQARENLKKIRAMIRRVQNRGLRHAVAARRASRAAHGRRRIERGHRCGRCREPDDDSRRERSGVSRGVSS